MIYPKLKDYCSKLASSFGDIPEGRKVLLSEIADYYRSRRAEEEEAYFLVVCTHNSRRSHFGQAFIKVAAAYYGLPGISSFSGGTEATALHPNALSALLRAGFRKEKEEGAEGGNKRYGLSFSSSQEPLELFSKVYSEPPNPAGGYCGILVCESAAQACPVLVGAESRVPLSFEDPKQYDGTAGALGAYEERCFQIGRELLYAFSLCAED